MRFEVIAALVVGFLMPCLETGRRGFGYWAVDFTTMFEDYVAGALLLIAGWMAVDGRRHAATALVLAWAYFAGVMGPSFWDQLEGTLRGHDMEPNNAVVLGVKLALWSICIASLALAFRRVVREGEDTRHSEGVR